MTPLKPGASNCMETTNSPIGDDWQAAYRDEKVASQHGSDKRVVMKLSLLFCKDGKCPEIVD